MRERVPETIVQRWLIEYARRRDRGDAGRSRGDVSLDTLRGRIADAMHPLVESCARRFQASGEPVEDLVQEGYLGLLSALDHWDPSRGVKFSTYSVHFISGSIRHFLRDRCRPIREPARVHAMARRVEEASVELAQNLDRAPRADELAAVLDVTEEEVGEAIGSRGRQRAASIETDEDGLGIDAPDDALPISRLVEDRVLLERALAVLKPREQEVIYECYFRDLSQVEVAKKIGVSANYVSVTLRRATDRLRRVCMESEIRDPAWQREGRLVDSETGLYDRAQVHARIVEGVSRAARDSELFGLVAVRLGGMPESVRGRSAVLSACGRSLRKAIRRSDIGGRWSEDVLVALLPGTGETSAVVANRLEGTLRCAAWDAGFRVVPHCATWWHPEHGPHAADLERLLDGFASSVPIHPATGAA